MRFRSMLIAASLLIAILAAGSASARPNYATVFKKDYFEGIKDKQFAEEVNKGTQKCLLCHQGVKQKKIRNEFGKELSKLLKKEEKDPVKIADAIKKALSLHVDPKNDKSETYLDRWKANKWPVGTLEELKKEPAAPAADEKK